MLGKDVYFLVLMLFTTEPSASNHPALTTIPVPFATLEECHAAGKAWVTQGDVFFRYNYNCIKYPI